jgi:GH35 family endo-1,4-beta-xylanase
MTPDWLRSLEDDPAALQAAILRHIRDIGTATAPFAQYWDVMNEPMSHHDILDLLGPEKAAEWFHAAREVLPESRLVMNEFDIVGNGGSAPRRAKFLKFVADLRSHDAPLDVLGFQAHFWSDRLTPPERIWEIIDEVHDASGLPLMVSEFDMNLASDAIQADYTRDFLTAWFAHPATEAFIMWGFWGGAHWMGERGALFRKDWTPKPNLKAYEQLVLGDWWTDETLMSDAEGKISLRVFRGTHQVTIEENGPPSAFRFVSVDPTPRDLRVVLPRKQPD